MSGNRYPWGTPPGVEWVEATTTVGDVVWTVHVALPDFTEAVDRAHEALAFIRTPPAHEEDDVQEYDAAPVLQALATRPMRMPDLIEATGLSDATIRKHLRNLEAVGKVIVALGDRGRRTYSLNPNPPENPFTLRRVQR